MKLFGILYLSLCLPGILGDKFSEKQADQQASKGEDDSILSIVLSLIGLIIVCMEIVIYIREFRLQNVINFALFKSEAYVVSDQKLSNDPDTDIKARKTVQNQPQKIDDSTKKNIGLTPEVQIGQSSTRKKRRRKVDRLSSNKEKQMGNHSFESNDARADEQY